MDEVNKPNVTYCTNCGHKLLAEDKFCAGCGRPNPNYQAPEPGSKADIEKESDEQKTSEFFQEETDQSKKQTDQDECSCQQDSAGDIKAQNVYTYQQRENPGEKDSIASIVIAIVGLPFFAFGPVVYILLEILALIVGIVGAVKKKEHNKSMLGILISVIALLLAVVMLILSSSDESDTDTSNEQVTEEAASTSEEETSTSEEEAPTSDTTDTTETQSPEPVPAFDTTVGMNLFNSGEYHYITTDDLFNSAPGLKGQKIYTVITIEQKKDDGKCFQADIGDNYMFTDFAMVDGSYDVIPEDTQVAVLGTVGEMTDLKITQYANVNDCYVFAVGDDAAQYVGAKSDEALSTYLTTSTAEDSSSDSAAAAAASDDLSEEQYKALCEAYSYKEILRNPDSYKNKYCKVSGSVNQTVDGFFGLYTTIYIKDANGNRWGCNYSYSDGESHVLEGDYVTVYGELDGTANTETVLGKQVTVPYVSIEYIN